LLRAARFAARLDFALEDVTREAIVELAPGILTVSAERIAAELRIMLTHRSRARAVRLLDELGLLVHVLPEVARMKGVGQSGDWHPEGDVFEHTLRCLEEAGEVDWELAMAVLLHDVGKPPTAQDGAFYAHDKVGADIAADVCRRLRESNRVRDRVVWLVRNHMRFRDAKQMKEVTLRRLMSEPDFETLAELHLIDAKASAGDFDNYDFVMDKYRRFQEEPPPVKPLVTGRDLIDRGLTPGPAFKEILDALAADQLEGKLKTRDDALKALDELLRRRK
ncbi:MAG TPA: HD domain-containing protein, partial [Planctomycetota bacterium]|nr:HD domain-containing protein [Planctomycetota bacterium]